MRIAAILPVKRFSDAKQRLSLSIAATHRQMLVEAMVADVLAAIGSVEGIDLTIVVTREQSAATAALARGALIVEDAEQGQSAAVAVGIDAALANGAERVLCIPGDCPALDPAEIAALLREHESPVVVIPDRHRTGTNGLLLTPPKVIAPSFGPGSRARHQELARAAGVRCELATPASLLLDIDTGADLEALRSTLASEDVNAPRTRAALAIIGEQTWEASHSAA